MQGNEGRYRQARVARCRQAHVGRCRQAHVGRCREMYVDVGKCRQMQGNESRCRYMQGNVGREKTNVDKWRVTSVTRWLDYLFNIWPFTRMKIGPIANNLAQNGSIFFQILNKPAKSCQRL